MKKDWRLVGEILVQEFMHLSRRIKFYLRLILVAEGALLLGWYLDSRGKLGDWGTRYIIGVLSFLALYWVGWELRRKLR